ncbi:acetyl-CoA carboxylase biotin carboxyl carrier protein [Slackia heliotrinireducens]|jgi:acetyl-CoA carboxylase biotin carboxyl carrier protein|uniref:Biotin carboxyl carrier protein of acetyl-CoA carboxylase n=1 Tax=Slackia heliotrinireducens (strain ATCC 29202 / DSM 20476 / NCTC 11029 / RHS 1) TaxID=471855 RepID=C7N0V5_SLAHD|nr:acetyl-CoA carboxylase biotin carboxyl carrier protein [Slackia heliotrinireducens]ACV21183.1 acetyl-CoA carboxylase, biotin carboxyl carrier protein [Slackia heliotrinireducens DSM 20476]VEG98618.1 Biotin carboxyl carrier protein of acetyl-CoA carboxylase [Slackia heliotrinireducens]
MHDEKIRAYAEIMDEMGLTGLEVEEGGAKIRLERGVPQAAAPVVITQQGLAGDGAADAESATPKGELYSVRSPLVGVFYVAPAENAEPFVMPGDRVKKGQTLCIVEAMKLMNEITAEEPGVVEKVCVTNGQMVEYGAELFQIRR